MTFASVSRGHGRRNRWPKALGEAGVVRGTRLLARLNQVDGYDCPGCAWPDPDGHRSAFEFCENGAKAVAEEGTSARIGASIYRRRL